MEQFKRFLGSGWSFGVRIDPDGGVSTSWHEQNVEQNIRIILGTALGERQMRPDFGCKIHDLVFAPNNRPTANSAEAYVHQAIQKWEPRVGDVKVKANPDPYEPHILRIDITYTIRTTNTTRNLVFPFYISDQEGSA